MENLNLENGSLASPRNTDTLNSPRSVESPKNVDQEMQGDVAPDTSSKASISSASSSVVSRESSTVQPDLKRSKLAISTTTITTTNNSKSTKTVVSTYRALKPMSGRMSVPVNKLLSSQKSSATSGRLSAPLTTEIHVLLVDSFHSPIRNNLPTKFQ